MDLTFIFEFIIFFALGWYSGQKVLLISLAKKLAMLQEIANDQNQPTKEKVKSLKIEQVESILFLYENESNIFICQGTTVTELAELAKKYKNINYATVTTHTDEILLFMNGEVITKAMINYSGTPNEG